MMSSPLNLSRLFQAVLDELIEKRAELNWLDHHNQNHGDHMVQIFQVAVRAAGEMVSDDLAATMDHTARLLQQLPENGSAQLYGRGLACLAAELRQRNITLDDLAPYVQAYAQGAQRQGSDTPGRSADILKALLSALAEWERLEGEQPGAEGGLNLGYLLGVGMAYMQARSQGGDKLQTLADTVVSVSPMGRVPHRRSSGLAVVQALLRELGKPSEASEPI